MFLVIKNKNNIWIG